MNIQKGIDYEKFIKSNLLTEHAKNGQVWLWDEIPEFELRKAGMLGDWNEHRLTKKDNKINGLPDLGTDILLKIKINENDFKYILIQCKNYAAKNYVTIQCLAGFYAMCIEYEKDGIVYYTSKLSSNLKSLIQNKNVKFIKKVFDDNQENNGMSPDNIKLIDRPYYYQTDAYQNLKNIDRTILNLPCGMGKTLTSIMLSRDYENIVIISPLIAYAKQNLERYMDELSSDGYKSIFVCSEGTRDEVEIIENLNKNNKNILSFTYDSVDILIKIISKLKNYIVILDEFHNLSKNDIVKNDNGDNTPLNKLLYSNSKILFMSATPKFFQFEDSELVNQDVFGNNMYSFPMGKAIENKHICDYEVYLPDLRTPQKIDEISEEVSIKDFDFDLTIKAKFLLRGMMESGSRKCIVYLRNQQEANDFNIIINKLTEYFIIELNSNVIISDTTHLQRQNIIDNFNNFNGYSIICSVQILNECIDIPKCDSIFMSYRTESKILIIQRMCRANRLDKENPNKISKIFLWSDEYNDIGFFISQLKEFDETFIENKVLIINTNGNQGQILERNKIENKQIYQNLDNIIISVRRFGYSIDSWKNMLQEIKNYLKENNKPLAKSNNIVEKKYGKWWECQVYDYKVKRYIMKLPEIRKIWEEFVNENNELFKNPRNIWTNHLTNLENFIIKNNRLPTQGITDKNVENINDTESVNDNDNDEEYNENTPNLGFKLAKWIVRNNEQLLDNSKAMSNSDNFNDWINFKNKYSHLFNAKQNEWQDILNNLSEFIKKNKRLPVENVAKKEEYNLKIWYKTQLKQLEKTKFSNDSTKIQLFQQFLKDNNNILNTGDSNLELWIVKYNEFVEYIEKKKSLPKERVKIDNNMTDGPEKDELLRLKSLGIWKSNNIQYAKINFSTVIPDINPSKLTETEKEKFKVRLAKFNEEKDKMDKVLSKVFDKLNAKEKKEYLKMKERFDEQKKRFEEERYEASEKNRLWNEIKNKYPILFK